MLLDKCGSRDVAQCPTLKLTFAFVVSPQFAPRCSLVARSRRGPARLDREQQQQQQQQQEKRESHGAQQKEMRECIDGVVMITLWLRRLVIGGG